MGYKFRWPMYKIAFDEKKFKETNVDETLKNLQKAINKDPNGTLEKLIEYRRKHPQLKGVESDIIYDTQTGVVSIRAKGSLKDVIALLHEYADEEVFEDAANDVKSPDLDIVDCCSIEDLQKRWEQSDLYTYTPGLSEVSEIILDVIKELAIIKKTLYSHIEEGETAHDNSGQIPIRKDNADPLKKLKDRQNVTMALHDIVRVLEGNVGADEVPSDEDIDILKPYFDEVFRIYPNLAEFEQLDQARCLLGLCSQPMTVIKSIDAKTYFIPIDLDAAIAIARDVFGHKFRVLGNSTIR